ncbi:hypothetical protein ACF3M1_02240 [Luteimonas sp. WGS1318]|uniref:hypothetical protein n=1 Tax=Luteimonas sp. WGS1318 TaxID=3366815 RepID=UPI00372D58E7
MHRPLLMIATVAMLALSTAGTASAQALRNPADPPPRSGLRAVEPPRQLSEDVTRPVAPVPALSPQQRCLQTAERMVQPASDQRIAAAQRRLSATDTRRAAVGGDANDVTDRSGLRAQREMQQRAIVRERNAAAQRLAVAQANCR